MTVSLTTLKPSLKKGRTYLSAPQGGLCSVDYVFAYTALRASVLAI